MMERTSTKQAPWYLVPANDKLFGRLAAFKILIARLGKGVSLEPRMLDPKIGKLAAQLFDMPLPREMPSTTKKQSRPEG